MVDEAAFHASRARLNPTPCVFAKAILAGCASCSLAQRQALAEREVVACTMPVAHINCSTLKDLFYERATFVLRLPRPATEIPHQTAMKLSLWRAERITGGVGSAHAPMSTPWCSWRTAGLTACSTCPGKPSLTTSPGGKSGGARQLDGKPEGR